MSTFVMLYTFLGGLGMFFYGMTIMTDALQSFAGHVIRKVISSLTTNPILAVIVGATVTSIIQSSSITTVMIIGLVNAGLMQLTQAIGVVFGANIGTTITAWILSLNIGKYGLLLIGVSIFPVIFSKNNNLKNFGRIGIGIGMIFCGLLYMSDAVYPLRSMPEVTNFLAYFTDFSYSSFVANIVIGCLITAIIQSSSAFSGIVIAMGATGLINYSAGIALILGSNIGTTITAQLAAIPANTEAKRVALVHTLFNIFGVILVFPFLKQFMTFIDYLTPGDPNYTDPTGKHIYIPVYIALAHTVFNCANTIILLPFVKQISKLVTKIIPYKKENIKSSLLIGQEKDILPATALVQINKELLVMDNIVEKMSDNVLTFLTKDKQLDDLRDISAAEVLTDEFQRVITIYIGEVIEKPLSHDQSKEAQAYLRIADEYESIADYLEKLAMAKLKFTKEKKLSAKFCDAFVTIFAEIRTLNTYIRQGLSGRTINKITIKNVNRNIFFLCEELQREYLENIKDDTKLMLTAITFSEMINSTKKIRGHYYNIYQAAKRLIF